MLSESTTIISSAHLTLSRQSTILCSSLYVITHTDLVWLFASLSSIFIYLSNQYIAALYTSSTVIRFIHLWSIGQVRKRQGAHSTLCLIIVLFLPKGAVVIGSVEPNIATIGMPSASAKCIGPVSLVINTLHLLMNAANGSIVV